MVMNENCLYCNNCLIKLKFSNNNNNNNNNNNKLDFKVFTDNKIKSIRCKKGPWKVNFKREIDEVRFPAFQRNVIVNGKIDCKEMNKFDSETDLIVFFKNSDNI